MTRVIKFGLLAIVVMSVAATQVQAAIVVNSDFEAGTTGWTPVSWFVGNNGRGQIGTQSAGTGAVGSNAADNATISQVLITSPGTYYDLSFYVYADGLAGNVAAFPNELKVRWDGGVVADYLNIPTTNTSPSNFVPGGPMTLFTIPGLLATTPLTTLSFGGRHDPAGIFIDNVAVNATSAVPEPTTLVVWSAVGLIGLGFVTLRKKFCGACA